MRTAWPLGMPAKSDRRPGWPKPTRWIDSSPCGVTQRGLHTPHVPPPALQCLQYLQFLHAVHVRLPVQVAAPNPSPPQHAGLAIAVTAMIAPTSSSAIPIPASVRLT